MSGLLVKSTIIMRENLEELNTRGLADRVPVLLGGAALTRNYVERDLREVYDGRVFYGKDAFEGLRTMDTLMAGKRAGDARSRRSGAKPAGASCRRARAQRDAAADAGRRARRAPTSRPTCRSSRRRSSVHGSPRASRSTTSPATSTRPRCSATSGSSGPRSTAPRPTPSSRRASARRCATSSTSRKQEALLVPAAAWGYFAVNSEGNDLVVWKDDTRTQEWLRFSFPRQRKAPFLCIADFFRPVESGEPDYAAFHVVTMGRSRSAAREGAVRGRPVPGLPVAARPVGRDDRSARRAVAPPHPRGVGLRRRGRPDARGPVPQQYRGSRYSWGYPACPDLDDQAKVAELLEIDRIGVALTEEFHLVPEQSTSAIIVPHPEAKYFVV